MDKSKVKCIVCSNPIGENGVVYYNGAGYIEALCQNNHDVLLKWILHTPIDENSPEGIARLLFRPKSPNEEK